MKKIVFNVREDMYEKLLELQAEVPLFNVSETMRFCITQTYDRYMNNYKKLEKEKIRNKPSIVDREKAKLDAAEIREKAKKQKFIDEKMAICDVLGGTSVEVQPGIWVCEYKKFNEEAGKKVSTFDVKTPFDQLTPDTPEYQYTDIVGYQGKKAKEKILTLMGLK